MLGGEAANALIFEGEGSWDTPEIAAALGIAHVQMPDAECYPFDVNALIYDDPFVESLRLSLADCDGAAPTQGFVGLANYAELLRDSKMWGALTNNLILVAVGAPLSVCLGQIFALLLSDRPMGHAACRTVFFMPLVLAPLVIGLIWVWILAPRYGLLGNLLGFIGLQRTAPTGGWLGNPDYALYAVIAAWVRSFAGFHVVILEAGMRSVDDDLLDAARIDGARGRKRLWHVTLPQIRPVLTVVLILALTAAFKVFEPVYVMTGGGPANSTELMATCTHDKAFLESEVSYGASTVAGVVVLSCLAGYALARRPDLPGLPLAFVRFLLGLMVPFQALMIPLYYLARDLGILGTRLAMILLGIALGLPFGVFLMRGFFQDLPQDLVDAAKLDGCGEFAAVRKVMLPLSFPGIATVVVFQFMETSNSFLLPLIMLQSAGLRPVSLGLRFFTAATRPGAA